MGVFIKGMEMPKNCTECKIKGEGSDSLYTWSCPFTGFEYTRYDCANDRLDDCPLIEIQSPHGRLIDADAFDERVRVAGGMSEEELTEDFKDGVQTVLYMLSKQPTIIEAEGSEE